MELINVVTNAELKAMAYDNIRQGVLSVGVTSTNVSPYLQNTLRKVLVITNSSTNGAIITLSWGSTAIANQGIVLNPSGSWSESIDSSYIPSIQDIYAISNIAGGQISFQERIINC